MERVTVWGLGFGVWGWGLGFGVGVLPSKQCTKTTLKDLGHNLQSTSHFTRHISHITHHTSHFTHYTSHITHHPSHITHHTSPAPLYCTSFQSTFLLATVPSSSASASASASASRVCCWGHVIRDLGCRVCILWVRF